MADDVILRVENLVKHFPVHPGSLRRQARVVHAVDGVSFAVRRGRDPRARGGIGVRQVDHRPDRSCSSIGRRRVRSTWTA